MTIQLDLLQRAWCDRMALVVLDKMRGKDFIIDDIYPIVEPPEHANWYGILMAKLCRKCDHVGFRKSNRPSANKRKVYVWRIKEVQLA